MSEEDGKKKNVNVHRRPDPALTPELHKNYGLWIFAGGTSGISEADGFLRAENRYFEFYCLSHMYEGGGRLRIEGQGETQIKPGDCVVITPGTVHCYGGYGGNLYCEDTINFVGPVAEMLQRSGILSDGLVHAGTVRRLPPIVEMIRDPALDSQLKANIALQKLLVDLYLEKNLNRSEYPLFDELLQEITEHLDRWWTVSEMAERCNLSEDQLRRVFLKYTGGTPKLYLDRLKLKRAGELLSTSGRPIAEIAASLGYLDGYHFARRFKTIMGLSPGQYRTLRRLN